MGVFVGVGTGVRDAKRERDRETDTMGDLVTGEGGAFDFEALVLPATTLAGSLEDGTFTATRVLVLVNMLPAPDEAGLDLLDLEERPAPLLLLLPPLLLLLPVLD